MADSLHRSIEARLRAAVESAPSGLLMADADGRIVLLNREIERMFGYSREELLGQPIERLVPLRFRGAHPGYRGGFMREPKVRSMGVGRDLFGVRKDGTEVPVEIGLTPLTTEEGMFVLAAVVDISERKRLEEDQRVLTEQLRQSQKMEAIGTLAGGIAHDFNNLLGAVIGYAELIAAAVTDRPAVARDISQLTSAAMRGRRLVERILAFSRRQEAERRPLDLPELVREVQQLLRATLPAGIALSARIGDRVPRVNADPTSVHQVLMNLASNAAQAMPRGGALVFEVEPIYVRDSVARANPGLREGPYVSLTVRDNGSGMDTETRERAFEPFFTTKAPGAGTGLGLAMVHGIMQDHQGAVHLDSTLGSGTAVRCLFPALEQDITEAVPSGETESLGGRGEHLLYVDDESSLLEVSRRGLERVNYRVTTTNSPVEALALVQAATVPFDLLVTDYSMPGMNGVDLAVAAMKAQPGLAVILLTGFAEETTERGMLATGIKAVLRKPVLHTELAAACRRALDSPPQA